MYQATAEFRALWEWRTRHDRDGALNSLGNFRAYSPVMAALRPSDMSPPSSFRRIVNPEWTHCESQSDVAVIPEGRYGSASNRQKEYQLYPRHVAPHGREMRRDEDTIGIPSVYLRQLP